MKNRILPVLGVLLIGIMLIRPTRVFASVPLETDSDASLTLYYQTQGQNFPDLEIAVYRVAEAAPDGTFRLIAPFSSYPVNIQNIMNQAQWKNIATTLNAYITAQQVEPDRIAQTNPEGIAQFLSLKTGLYLVQQVIAETETGTYLFDRFMVYVPTPQPDGTYEYHVQAKPKCTNFIPKTQYTVTKLWQDAGDPAQRPKEITVEIYNDGKLLQTQTLNAGNDWSYTWSVSGENQGAWSVAEQSVPEGYKVTVQQSGTAFSIINTAQTKPDTPPQTGDSFAPLPWIICLCVSGFMLLILGIYKVRRL